MRLNMGKENTAAASFNSTDFYIVAMLVSQGFPIINIGNEGRDGKVKRFHFVDTEELRAAILKYTNGILEGNIKGFKNSIESIKDILHS
jgi:hypothetical protein